MLKLGDIEPLGFGAFSFFAVLASLTLLMSANYVSPGCTGPEVRRCDYIAAAKIALAGSRSPQAIFHPFSPDRGFEVFDQGSSVLVQQADPFGPDWMSHASSVLIDKKSCRPCEVGYSQREPTFPEDAMRGPMIMQAPAEDPVAAAILSEKIRAVEASWH